VDPISKIAWDSSLQPKKYSIFGTHPESKILFLDVNVLDSTGREPYRGDVLIEGEKLLKQIGSCPPRKIANFMPQGNDSSQLAKYPT
jgi:hypothetical protein